MKQTYKDKEEISKKYISQRRNTRDHAFSHFERFPSKTNVQRDAHATHGYNWKFSLMFARFSPPGDPVRRSTRVYYVLNINILRARGINRAVVAGGEGSAAIRSGYVRSREPPLSFMPIKLASSLPLPLLP